MSTALTGETSSEDGLPPAWFTSTFSGFPKDPDGGVMADIGRILAGESFLISIDLLGDELWDGVNGLDDTVLIDVPDGAAVVGVTVT